MIAPGCLSNRRSAALSAIRPIARFSHSSHGHSNSPPRVGAMFRKQALVESGRSFFHNGDPDISRRFLPSSSDGRCASPVEDI